MTIVVFHDYLFHESIDISVYVLYVDVNVYVMRIYNSPISHNLVPETSYL